MLNKINSNKLNVRVDAMDVLFIHLPFHANIMSQGYNVWFST